MPATPTIWLSDDKRVVFSRDLTVNDRLFDASRPVTNDNRSDVNIGLHRRLFSLQLWDVCNGAPVVFAPKGHRRAVAVDFSTDSG
jgi:hypothetical protein